MVILTDKEGMKAINTLVDKAISIGGFFSTLHEPLVIMSSIRVLPEKKVVSVDEESETKSDSQPEKDAENGPAEGKPC